MTAFLGRLCLNIQGVARRSVCRRLLRTARRGATDRRLRHGSGLVPHQSGVEPIKFVYAACEACDTRRHPDERSRRRWRCLRLAPVSALRPPMMAASRRVRSPCCPRAASGHPAAAPPSQRDDLASFHSISLVNATRASLILRRREPRVRGPSAVARRQ
jgi:hypothetical protein